MGNSKGKKKSKDCCHLEPLHDEMAYHSRYIKIIIFIVTIGAFSTGMAIYWELIVLFSRKSHLSIQMMFLLCVVLGALSAGVLMPRVGRRRLLTYSIILFFPAIIVNALWQSHHVGDFGARIFSGIATGAFLTAAIVYVGELPLVRYRNRYYAWLAFGYFCGGAIYAILFYAHAWLSLAFLLFPLIYFILALIYLPESPYFINQVNAENFASEVLYFLRCGNVNHQKREIAEMLVFINDFDCVHLGGLVDRCLTLLLLILFTFASGFPLYLLMSRAATYYISYTLIIVFSVLGWIVFFFCNELFTRSGLLMLSSAGVLLANIFLVLFFAVLRSVILLYCTMIVFFFFFFVGFAEMFFVTLGESFPYKAKHYSVAFGVIIYFVSFSFGCFLIRELMIGIGPTLTALHSLLHSVLALLFAMMVMPKYKKIGLLRIEEYFDSGRK